ncbi:hypothetical protein [uncultured Kordia sp.]|uniref:hypothetical protein n=1 Tax=uncultured Kordia sp. TaxID=507699 RepID=UPI0026287DB5|nr:hypothetical protein [uncultured Kordia sp.]
MTKNSAYTLMFAISILGSFILIVSTLSKNEFVTAEQQKYEDAHTKIQEAWKGKSLQLPTELYNTMTNEKVDLLSKIQNSKKKYTLISYLDGECSSCVHDLKKWEALVKKHPTFEEKLDIEFLITSGDIELLKYQVYDQAKSSFIFLWDKSNTFKPINKISDLKAYQTFLIKDNKIVFVGSPIRGEFYIEKLQEVITN